MSQNYSLPATAICPGCGAMVVLPAELLLAESPPAICATCNTEVPDHRRESYMPPASLPPSQAYGAPQAPMDTAPVEERRYSRGGLLRSLGGMLAERGAEAVEDAKQRFTG
jgi:hypothetical protein